LVSTLSTHPSRGTTISAGAGCHHGENAKHPYGLPRPHGPGIRCWPLSCRSIAMHVFSLPVEKEFNPNEHVEKILGRIADGDVTVACWEPGQISPYHCHPQATEIYFCFEGGGKMRTPERTIDVTPGSFVVHPAGELHEYINGAQRTL